MRKGLSIAYSGLGWLIVALGVVQFVLVGLALFDGESFESHRGLGWGIHTLTIVTLVFAVLGPRTRQDIILGVVLVVVTTIQTSLPSLRDDAGWLAAFHPVLALAVMGIAANIGGRYIGARGAAAARARPRRSEAAGRTRGRARRPRRSTSRASARSARSSPLLKRPTRRAGPRSRAVR